MQGRRIAGEAGVVQVQRGKVSTDGTTLQGHASRHKAMSDGSMKKAVERLREAMEALVTQAYQQDAADEAALGRRRGEEWPAELSRRADRLATIEAAISAWRRGPKPTERQRVREERKRPGKTRGGRVPIEVDETPEDQAQMRCTDPEWGSMQPSNTGWDDCGNAQASVDGAYQIIVACAVTAAANDQQHAVPMAQWTVAHLEQAGIERPKDAAGGEKMPGTYDSGYYSEAAAAAVEQLGFDPSMATGRQRHHLLPAEVAERPTTAKERMAAKGQSPDGRVLDVRRTAIVAPVFGQSKEARGFRRFLRRGLAHMRGEWCLVCLTHHLLKLWRYTCAPITVSAGERVPDVPQRGFFRTTCLA